MIHLITGGSGSGKSSFAEQQVMRIGGTSNIYIATMIPYGEEGRQRVERHRALRKEKNFDTIECYLGLDQLEIPEKSNVLLECMSNLVANEIFEPAGAHEHTASAITKGIKNLSRQAENLFIVTNEVFSDGIEYDPTTMDYLRCLGEVNQQLAALADQVTEVVYGIPVILKEKRRNIE